MRGQNGTLLSVITRAIICILRAKNNKFGTIMSSRFSAIMIVPRRKTFYRYIAGLWCYDDVISVIKREDLTHVGRMKNRFTWGLYL